MLSEKQAGNDHGTPLQPKNMYDLAHSAMEVKAQFKIQNLIPDLTKSTHTLQLNKKRAKLRKDKCNYKGEYNG
ncbi:hypothetical protein CUU52_04950 [Pectobacterium polaris]|nr:hypothetical protein [Pectobacterium polaris]